MNTNDERLSILTLVKHGKIDINEATDLLRALDRNESTPAQTDPKSQTLPATHPHILHIIKTDTSSKTILADVTVPLDLLLAGIRVGANFYLDLAGLNTEQIDLLINEPNTFIRLYGNVLLDLEDENTNEHISVKLQ